jgi:hypothetical protein
MTTTEWSDVYTSIAANEVLVSMEESGGERAHRGDHGRLREHQGGLQQERLNPVRGGGRPGQQDVAGAPVSTCHSGGPASEANLRRVR